MCNSNAAAVKAAEKVETDSHTDLIELRLDHLAGGAAVVLILGTIALVYCLCRQRQQRRQPSPMYPFVPFQPPMPYQPPQTAAPLPITWHVSREDIGGIAEALAAYNRRMERRRLETEHRPRFADVENDLRPATPTIDTTENSENGTKDKTEYLKLRAKR